jgi:hypothetical protein
MDKTATALRQIELPRSGGRGICKGQPKMRALKNIIKALLVAVLLPVVYGQSTNPPTLLIQPDSQAVAAGSTLSLPCG